ncbi:MAG: hypothetical protein M3R43_01440 [Acidobacteriota bacterium]|nr:hypothetical protein [Acidobacteriota bacterium]
MKAGTENRNKTILLGVLGTCALVGVGYTLYNTFADSSPTPPSTIVPIGRAIDSNNDALNEPASPSATVAKDAASRPAAMPTGNAAGIAAKKMATSSASLDPTLNQSAMLRTEHLVYAGSGRNIFSALYTPPIKIPVATHSPRPGPPVYVPPPLPTGPPPPPPINLKFFGTATRADGSRQAFLLQGDDVFLASQGDIVARKYRIVSISANSLQVEDLANNNTQTLPLQSN